MAAFSGGCSECGGSEAPRRRGRQIGGGALEKIYPEDVRVMTKDEFVAAEKQYWAVRTPIGFVIGASMAVAILWER